MIRLACPACQAQLELPSHLAGTSFPCGSCGKTLYLPASSGHDPAQSIMDRLLAPAPPVTHGSLPLPPPPGHGPAIPAAALAPATPASPPPPEPAPIRRQRPAYMDDEEEGDYFDTGRRRPQDRDAASMHRSALLGMTTSLIGLLLTLVGVAIWLFSMNRTNQPAIMRSVVLIIFFQSVVSFTLCLIGLICSSRGMSPANESNRGLAIAGLVCGIIGIVISLLMGFFFFLCGILLSTLPF